MVQRESPVTAVIHRHLHQKFPLIKYADGMRLYLEDGREILDASGGASVACLGHSDTRVKDAVMQQMNLVSYCATTFFSSKPYEELCQFLVDSTGGKMVRAYIVSSGEYTSSFRGGDPTTY